jgi:hypothetical protein
MTEPLNPDPHAQPTPDETFTWTGDDAAGTGDAAGSTGSTGSSRSTGSTGSSGAGGANAILESLREAVDDLAERATPAVREFGARAAEFAAVAADRAAPLVRRAGEVTSDASGRLAEKSRTWASDIRASMGDTEPDANAATPPTGASDATGPAPTDIPPPAPAAERSPSDGPTSPA